MARLFPSGPSSLVSVTFNSSQYWTVPAGVSNLEVLSGLGEDGSLYTWQTQTLSCMSVAYLGNLPHADNPPMLRSTAYNAGITEANKFAGTAIRTVSWNELNYSVYSDNDVILTSNARSETVKGSAATHGSTGGGYLSSASTSDYVSVDVQVDIGTTPGSDSTAFSRTFPGGSTGPASPLTYYDVTVTPGSSNYINVAPGGYVTVQYYI